MYLFVDVIEAFIYLITQDNAMTNVISIYMEKPIFQCLRGSDTHCIILRIKTSPFEKSKETDRKKSPEFSCQEMGKNKPKLKIKARLFPYAKRKFNRNTTKIFIK
jgi:hypothetical protein